MTVPILPDSAVNTSVNNDSPIDDTPPSDIYRAKIPQRKPLARKGKDKGGSSGAALSSKLAHAVAQGVSQAVTSDEQDDSQNYSQQHSGQVTISNGDQAQQTVPRKSVNDSNINKWLQKQGIQIEPPQSEAAKQIAKLLYQLHLIESKPGSGLPKVISNLKAVTIRLGSVQEKGYENSIAVYNDETNTITLNLSKIKQSGVSLLQVLVHESLHAIEDLQRTSSASLGDTELATQKKEMEYGSQLHKLGFIKNKFVNKPSEDPDNFQSVAEKPQYQPVTADLLKKWFDPKNEPILYSSPEGGLYLSAFDENGKRVEHYLGSSHSVFLQSVPLPNTTQFTYYASDKSYHFLHGETPLRLTENGELFLVNEEDETPQAPPRPRIQQTERQRQQWDNWNRARSTLEALLYGQSTGDQQAVDGQVQAGQNHETRTKEKTLWEAAWERMYTTGSLKNLTLSTGPQDRSRTGSHSTGHRDFLPTLIGWFKGVGNGASQVINNMFRGQNPNAHETLERTISDSERVFNQHGVQDQLQRLLDIKPLPANATPEQQFQYNQTMMTKLYNFLQSMPKGAKFSIGAEGGVGLKWPTTVLGGVPGFLGFAAITGVTGENSIEFSRGEDGKLKVTMGGGAGFKGLTLEIGTYGDFKYAQTPFIEGDLTLGSVSNKMRTSFHLNDENLFDFLFKLVIPDSDLSVDWVVQNADGSTQVGKYREVKPITGELLFSPFAMGAFGPAVANTGAPGVGASSGIMPGISLHVGKGIVLRWSGDTPYDPENPDFGLTFQNGKPATYFTDTEFDLGGYVWGRPAKLLLTGDDSTTIGQANQLFKIADLGEAIRDNTGAAKQPDEKAVTNQFINITGIKVTADNLDQVIKKYPELARFFENDPDAKWRLENALRHKAEGGTTLNIELRLKQDKFDKAEGLQQIINENETALTTKKQQRDLLKAEIAQLEPKEASNPEYLDKLKQKVILDKAIQSHENTINNKREELGEILKHRGNFELSGYNLLESRNVQNKRGLSLVFVSVNSTNDMKFEDAILRESTIPGQGVSKITNNERGITTIEHNRGRSLQLIRNAVDDNSVQRQKDFAINSAEIDRLRQLVATGQASPQEVEALNNYDDYLEKLAANADQALEKGTISHHRGEGVSDKQAASDAGEKVASWGAAPGGAVIMAKYGTGENPNWIPAFTATRNKEGVVSIYTAQGKLLKRFNNENGQNQQKINTYLQKLTKAEGNEAKFQVWVTKSNFKQKFDEVASRESQQYALPTDYNPADLTKTKVQTEFERIKTKETENPHQARLKLQLNNVSNTLDTNEPITKLLADGRVVVVQGDQITIKTPQTNGEFTLKIYSVNDQEYGALARDIRLEHQQKVTDNVEIKKSEAYALGLKIDGQSITADTQLSGQSNLNWDFDRALLALFHDPENFERNRRLFLQATITAGNGERLSEAETTFIKKAKQLLQSTSDFDEFLGKAKQWGNNQSQVILTEINNQFATAGDSQQIESITLSNTGEYVVKYRTSTGSENSDDKKFASINELLTNIQSDLPDTTKQKLRALREQGGLADFVQKRFETRDKVLKSGWGQRAMSLYSGFGTWNGIRVLAEYGVENDPLARLQAASTILGAVEEVLSGIADVADLAKRFNLRLPNGGTKAFSNLGKLGKAAGPLGIITSAFDLIGGAFGLDAAIRNGDSYEIAASSFDIVGGGLGMAAGLLALNPVTAVAAPFVAVAALLMSAISQGVRAAKAIDEFEKEVRPLSFWEKLAYGAATFFGVADKTSYPEQLRIARMNKAIDQRKQLIDDQEKLVQLVFRMSGDDQTSSSSQYPDGSTFLYGQHPRVKAMTEEQLKHANERLRSLGVSEAEIKRLTPLILDTGPKDILTEQRGYGPTQRAVFYNVNDGFDPNQQGEGSYQQAQQDTDSSSVINTGNRVLAFTYNGRSSDRVVYGFQDKGNTFITTEAVGQRYVGADQEDTVHYMMPSVRPEIAIIKNETVRKAVLNMPLNSQEAFANMNATAREALVNAMTAIAEQNKSAQSPGFNWSDTLEKYFSQQNSDIAKHFQVVFRGSKRMTTDGMIPGDNWLEKITNGIASLRQATGPDEASMYVYSTYIMGAVLF